VLYAFNKGEVCTCPSRPSSRVDLRPLHGAGARAHQAIRQVTRSTCHHDRPQVSRQQIEKIASYVDIGRQEA